MSEESHYKQLITRLKKRSEWTESTWGVCSEWVVVKSWRTTAPITCLSGMPSHHLYLIKNFVNGNEEYVDVKWHRLFVIHQRPREAVNDFKRLSQRFSDSFWVESLYPVENEPAPSVKLTHVKKEGFAINPSLLIYARLENILTPKEYVFLVSMAKSKWETITKTQLLWYREIVGRLIAGVRLDKLEHVFWPHYGIY